jgi:hypothetical protein
MLSTIELPPGVYLIGAKPIAAQRSRSELEFDLLQIVSSVGG